MRILVTGAAGFIASHVADAYLEQDHEVFIIDNLSTGNLHNIPPQAKFIQQDIRSADLDKVFADVKPHVVSHHAAQISVPLSVKDPLLDTDINVKGTLNLLQNCVKYQVAKFIFASSGGAIYGEAQKYPTSETCPVQPLSPYAVNKAIAESFLYYYGQQFGLNYVILRYANVYGPRQVSHGEAGVVSIFIEKLLAGQQPVLNAFPDQPDGMLRDYIFVQDVVSANLAALSYQGNNTFNIGTSIATSTGALFAEIARQLVSEVKLIPGPARDGDLHRSLLDCEKAEQLLAWKPHYSLQSGIAATIEFFKNKT
jgi:UDP-glucose 4-epimerase